MAAIAWLAAHTPSVGFLLATRYLARDPGSYTAPLVLLILVTVVGVLWRVLAN